MPALTAAALVLRDGDRGPLVGWTRASSVGAGLAQRARIVFLAAEGVSSTEIAARTGVQSSHGDRMAGPLWLVGIEGLFDMARPGRPRHIDHERIIVETLKAPPKSLGVTHWSSRLLGARLKVGNDHDRPSLAGVRGAAVASRDVQAIHRSGAGREGDRRSRVVPGASGERGGAGLPP